MDRNKLNDLLKDYLIKARESAGLSQGDVAARSDVFGLGKTIDQRTVSRIESQPLSVDALKIAGYLAAVGRDPQDYYKQIRQFTTKEEHPFMEPLTTARTFQKISEAQEKIETVNQMIQGFEDPYLAELKLQEIVEGCDKNLRALNRKAIIGCLGQFDAGKSTLINTLLNKGVLPAKFQPATSVLVVLMHSEDRPLAVKNPVAVFKKGFDPNMIYSEDLVAKYFIAEGGIDLLEKFGLHDYDADDKSDAYVVIVFDDAEILKQVWLLDTPGELNSADDSDTEKALSGVEMSDGIVFISGINGFLKDSDLGFAANIMRQKPPVNKLKPLDHILFVQSHCHSEIMPEDVLKAKNDTFKRTHPLFEKLVFSSWREDGAVDLTPSPEDMAGRTQPFWRENDIYRNNTMDQIGNMAEFLASNYEVIVDRHISKIVLNLDSAIKSGIDALESKKQASAERIKEIETKEARFREGASELNSRFKTLISSCGARKKDDLEIMTNYYDKTTSSDYLETLISETYSDKKDAQNGIGSYVSQLISTKLEKTIKTSGRAISLEVENILAKWQEIAPRITQSEIGTLDSQTLEISGFDARGAFIGGLAGLGSLGAMALYVSTIASNLGAYILVGKAAGVLVSLGLASSVTSVTSLVAAIGGPITIGIALACFIGFIFYRAFGDSWQRSLAKKVSEAIHKEDVMEKVEETILKFWDSSETAIQAGFDELCVKTDEYIESIKQSAKTEYDASKLDKCIDHLVKVLAGNVVKG